MIRENQKLLNRINILSDILLAFCSVVAAYLLIFYVFGLEKNYPLTDYIKAAVLFAPMQLMTFGCMGLYGSFRTKTFVEEFGRIVRAFLADGVIMVTLLYIFHIIDFSRWALFAFMLTDMLMITAKRFVLRRVLKSVRVRGQNKKYVLLVGSGRAARAYLEAISSEKQLGFECVGYIGAESDMNAQRLGDYDDILKVLESRGYDEVVCALGNGEAHRLSDVVEACELTGTKISVIPVIYRYMSPTSSIDMVGDVPLMNIRRIPLDNIGNAFLKRLTDIVGSLVLIVLTSPIMLVSALVIKLTMGGNVIFRQKRVGLNKKIFTMYKLKSMRDSAESDTAWSTDNDPRKTRFGAFIRKLSIDELPQLFNVLKGDMSLVGPRPEIPFYVNTFKDSVPMYMIKHQVKPGITGLAQVNGYRGDTSIEKRIEYDIRYIEGWTYFLDLSILLRTLFSFMNKEKLVHGNNTEKTADGQAKQTENNT